MRTIFVNFAPQNSNYVYIFRFWRTFKGFRRTNWTNTWEDCPVPVQGYTSLHLSLGKVESLLSSNGILQKSLLFSINKEERPLLQLLVASTERKHFCRVNKSTPIIKIFNAFARPKELDQINIKISSFSHDIPP